MKNVYILNAAVVIPGVAEGKLNASFVDKAKENLTAKGYEVRTKTVVDGYEVPEEFENLKWADAIIIQTPSNWFSVPAPFKAYMDTVLSMGMGGDLCNGDGRHKGDTGEKYATGGTLSSKYMISATFNAPADAFENKANPIIKGKNVDDVFFSLHMSMQFCGCKPIDSFSAHDVIKNPQIEKDFERFEEHLNKNFPAVTATESS